VQEKTLDFIDLSTQQQRILLELEANMKAVLRHGQYIMGPEIKELEKKLADYVGVKHAVACASGTDALLMALMAYGVAPGDAIFTTPFTFIATAEVISLLGATPVFVDIDAGSFNIDPDQLEQTILAIKAGANTRHAMPRHHSPRGNRDQILKPRGIIAVNLFGLPADYVRINAIAAKHGLFVVEDAAQSFGAEYHGRKSGSLAEIGCPSFFPAKPLGCYGDGGMCFTEDPGLADLLDSIRNHGKGEHKYENVRIGINGRLDTLQAAVLLAKFEIFPEEIELRRQVAEHYSRLLAGNSSLTLPRIPHHGKSVWAQYSLLARDNEHRTRLQESLKEAGIPAVVYYPLPLHLQAAFSHLGYQAGEFPTSEDCASRIFSLPMHPYLRKEDQERIAKSIMKAAD
jgi:UDP-2-acetamido-2-deoxy-ribo-hexuluronate aminotransferase